MLVSEIIKLNYRTRNYNPSLGRFMSEDPIGLRGGDSNIYRYVNNSPVRYVDPQGKFACGGLCIAVAASASYAGGYAFGTFFYSLTVEDKTFRESVSDALDTINPTGIFTDLVSRLIGPLGPIVVDPNTTKNIKDQLNNPGDSKTHKDIEDQVDDPFDNTKEDCGDINCCNPS